jgi:hypothetical protein
MQLAVRTRISKMERRSGIYLSTLRKIIEAMRGELDIIARMPDGPVRTTQCNQLRAATKPQAAQPCRAAPAALGRPNPHPSHEPTTRRMGHPEIPLRSFGWCGRVRHPPACTNRKHFWIEQKASEWISSFYASLEVQDFRVGNSRGR